MRVPMPAPPRLQDGSDLPQNKSNRSCKTSQNMRGSKCHYNKRKTIWSIVVSDITDNLQPIGFSLLLSLNN
ncbi:unnamed protein product [Linum tenue]|uniref:Uncharacterized protein n=1 Tax=Linum tenue TaxID=586396 RepID=A0AAV0P7B1_9ROSI|nr:unnamed protein product [Linum tenue]